MCLQKHRRVPIMYYKSLIQFNSSLLILQDESSVNAKITVPASAGGLILGTARRPSLPFHSFSTQYFSSLSPHLIHSLRYNAPRCHVPHLSVDVAENLPSNLSRTSSSLVIFSVLYHFPFHWSFSCPVK